MSELCVHHHLGLGDHFDCNGMIRQMLKTGPYDKVHVFSKCRYHDMIDFMYRDEDNIVVVKIDTDKSELEQVSEYYENSTCTEFLRIGHEHYPFEKEHLYDKNCWEFFYDQIDMPYNVRTDMFYFERDIKQEERLFNKLNPDHEPYIFIHDDAARGYELNRGHFLNPSLKTVENDITENIFYFIKILEEAEEIHCMESSFKSLVDLYAKTENIFYHDFRNQPLGNYTNKKWNVIKYD